VDIKINTFSTLALGNISSQIHTLTTHPRLSGAPQILWTW